MLRGWLEDEQSFEEADRYAPSREGGRDDADRWERMPYDVRRATQGIAVDSVIIQVSLPSSLHAAPRRRTSPSLI